MINDKVDPFVNQYRDALERQRDLSMQNLDNTRRNDFAQIMGAANKAGMMYSNFPTRSKIQYDTSNYMPSQQKIHTNYQTGLDKLRGNVVDLSNQLKSINEAIADLNKTNTGGTSKPYNLTIDGTTYSVIGSPTKDKDGRIEYNTADGQGIISIDPKVVKTN